MSKLRKSLSSFKQPLKAVEITELKETVYIRRLSVKEMMDYEMALFGDGNEVTESKKVTSEMASTSITMLLALTLCDSEGVMLYTCSKEDLEEIKNLDQVIANKLAVAARAENKIGINEVKSELKN